MFDFVRHETGVGDHAPAIREYLRVPGDFVGKLLDGLLVGLRRILRLVQIGDLFPDLRRVTPAV